jgi:hypothetical protein
MTRPAGSTIVATIAALACAMLAGCANQPDAPSTAGPLRLTASVTSATISEGHPATLSIRLENTGSATVTLTFPTSCQLRPYIVTTPGGETVYPAGGEWVCASMVTSLVIPPGGAATRQVVIGASQGDQGTDVVLPAGAYAAVARVDSGDYTLESNSVALTVEP